MSESIPNLPSRENYRAHWQRVGPVLAAIRRRELRAMTWEQRILAIEAVLALARPESRRNQLSGLAEFYRRHRDRWS
ncbi:MAG: hypothetical protein SH850_07670 [Planctomycetaceae bacterium]|nr:hypothetical protein [Planctomycetaceae bacterium]